VPTQPQLPSVLRVRRLALLALLVSSLTAILLLSGLWVRAPYRSGSVRLAHSLPHRLGHIRPIVNNAAQGTILTVAPTQPGKQFSLGAVGLSIETEELATRDRDLSTNHNSLIALMRLLGPGVLRVGGNSLDYSWWTSNHEPPPAWATRVITPAALVSLREFLKATDWRAILGVDFGHFNPARAADEARMAQRILGSRLLGVEIGNEPHGYSAPSINLRGDAYSVNAYLKEVSAYSAAIHATSPTIPLYGPDLSALSWITAIASAPRMPFAVLTGHYYPTQYNLPSAVCNATAVPSALDLLSPQVRQEENTWLEMLVTAGQLAHRPIRISETNTTASCDLGGGPDTGPVFASALWSLDWILRSASAGVTGLNFHGYFGLCAPSSYSPICAPSNVAEARGQVTARPEFYGLLAARQLEGGRFVPVAIEGQSASGDLTAYATVHPHNVITLAIENFSTDGSASTILKVRGYKKATSESLVAPSTSAASHVTFGHAAFNTVGMLRPKSTKVPGSDGGFPLELAPSSAMIVTLQR
jgi:hypothetical protein